MSDSPSQIGNNRIASLDGLRALSILLVIFQHSKETAPEFLRSINHLWTFLGNGQLGVRMFFIISGYLITTLLIREQATTGRISIRDFYQRRILRIFPAFYLYLGVICLLAQLGILRITLSDFLRAGTFTWNYGHLFTQANGDWHVIGHFWTLALEEQFYLFWPLTMVLLGARGALRVAIGIILLSPVIRVATYLCFPPTREFIAMMLHTGGDTLMFGAAAAMLAGKPRFEKAAQTFLKPSVALATFAFVFIASPLVKSYFKGMYDLPLGVTMESFSLTVLLLYVSRHPQSLAGKLLNLRIITSVGLLSYSLYLWNPLFFSAPGKTWTPHFLVGYVLTFAAAAISYWCVESPFLRLKRNASTLSHHSLASNSIVITEP